MKSDTSRDLLDGEPQGWDDNTGKCHSGDGEDPNLGFDPPFVKKFLQLDNQKCRSVPCSCMYRLYELNLTAACNTRRCYCSAVLIWLKAATHRSPLSSPDQSLGVASQASFLQRS